MKNRKADGLIALLLIIGLLGILWAYPSLPQIIPIHWNFKGEVDGMGSKANLFFILGLTVFLNLMFMVMPKIDPKKENYEKFGKVYHIFRVLFTVFMLALIASSIAIASSAAPININRFMYGSLGILFGVMGNYLPKCKHNYTLGIKTPWTLASESVWNKTHRMAGPLWLGTGIGLIVCCFVFDGSTLAAISFILLLVLVLIPTIYSYKEFKKEKQ